MKYWFQSCDRVVAMTDSQRCDVESGILQGFAGLEIFTCSARGMAKPV